MLRQRKMKTRPTTFNHRRILRILRRNHNRLFRRASQTILRQPTAIRPRRNPNRRPRLCLRKRRHQLLPRTNPQLLCPQNTCQHGPQKSRRESSHSITLEMIGPNPEQYRKTAQALAPPTQAACPSAQVTFPNPHEVFNLSATQFHKPRPANTFGFRPDPKNLQLETNSMPHHSHLRYRLIPLILLVACVALSPLPALAAHPNIILIYADDIGYGDLGRYGATAVKTPHLDSIATAGLRFTDAHCSSATCTPSRFSLLTGQYAWRKPGTGILPGDASLIIPPGTPTIPSTLKSAGYTSGVVGKWHLGLGAGDLDWNGDIKPGPLEIGFDYCYLIPATGDRVPCVYVENHRVVGLDPADPIRVNYGSPIGNDPTGRDRPDLLKMKLTHGHDMSIVNGISRIGYMTGGKAAHWVAEDMADVITSKAVQFIEKNEKSPFFLFFATHDIHVP